MPTNPTPPRPVSGTPTTDPELIKWDAIHAEHRERYRLPPDIGARGLDLNAAEVSSDKAFTVREAEMRVIGAAMDWANNDAEDEIEQVAREMGIACCLADLAKAIVDTPVAAVDGQRREGLPEVLDSDLAVLRRKQKEGEEWTGPQRDCPSYQEAMARSARILAVLEAVAAQQFALPTTPSSGTKP